MDEALSDRCPLVKRKRGRPRKNNLLPSEISKSTKTVVRAQKNNQLEISIANEPHGKTRRSGRVVKVPEKYGSYVTHGEENEDDVTVEEPVDMYECDACEKTFLTRSSIYVHQNKCTFTKELPCDSCQEKLYSYKDLFMHQKAHHSYTCDFCKQTFRNISQFRIHSRWHSLQTLECSICHRRFLRGRALKEHMVQVHDQPMELYSCGMCQKTFALLDCLKEHQKTHEGEEGFTVEYIVKPIVKDTTKRNTCAQDKPDRAQQNFVKKLLNRVDENNIKNGNSCLQNESDNANQNFVEKLFNVQNKTKTVNKEVPVEVEQSKISARESVKRARKEIKDKKNVVVHVHIQSDKFKGQKILTTYQEKQVMSSSTEQSAPREEISEEAIGDNQLSANDIVVLTESEEAVNELVRQCETTMEPEVAMSEARHMTKGNIEQDAGTDSIVMAAPLAQNLISECEEVVVNTNEKTNNFEEDPAQVVVSEQIIQSQHQQHVIIEDQGDKNNQEAIQENQIFLPDGQTIIVNEQTNLEQSEQIYLQTMTEDGQLDAQQIVMHGEGPTVFVQEGPNGLQQHVVLQTTEDNVGSDTQHVVVQGTGDLFGNNQHVIMQCEDGIFVLESNCSVGDSIIEAAMQNV